MKPKSTPKRTPSIYFNSTRAKQHPGPAQFRRLGTLPRTQPSLASLLVEGVV